MKVSEVMHEGACCITPEWTICEAAQMMRDEDIGALPVCENDRLIGMLTDRDIIMRCIAEGKDSMKTQARHAMSEQIIYCRSNEEIEDAIRLMEDHEVRRLPVLDDNNKVCGVLSLGDISHKVSYDLSGEVIRSVSDHHDANGLDEARAHL